MGTGNYEKEPREKDTRQITSYGLLTFIQNYNRDHALKLELHINEERYNVITIKFPKNDYPKTHEPIEVSPMTNLEAYYFVKGFRFLRDRPSCG